MRIAWILFLIPLLAWSKSTSLDCGGAYALLSNTADPAVAGITLSAEDFDEVTRVLTKTLSGNLSTVLRSEWKAKGNIQEANQFIGNLLDAFLTKETRAMVLDGLDPQQEDFIRQVAARLNSLDKAKKLRPGDFLLVRDAPPPPGASDSTFTYYTKAIRDPGGGKHQIRIRNYVRKVELEKMVPEKVVAGFNKQGSLVEIDLLPNSTPPKFQVTTTAKSGKSVEILSGDQIKGLYGDPPTLFAAPHGKSFKLEVKTRLKDEISGAQYPSLAGKNFVEKLDVTLSSQQLDALFGKSSLSPAQRLELVKKELLAEPGANPERVDAIFLLLEKAVAEDSSFLHLAGSTRYSRNAFEIAIPDEVGGKPVKVQTTVDSNQMVYTNVYGTDGSFHLPAEVLENSPSLGPLDPLEPRHWELKIPKPLVDKTLGGNPYQGSDSLPVIVEVDHRPPSDEVKQIIKHFSYSPVTNRGKFNHILEQRPRLDSRPVSR